MTIFYYWQVEKYLLHLQDIDVQLRKIQIDFNWAMRHGVMMVREDMWHVTRDDVVTRDNCHNPPALIKLTSIKFTHGPHHIKNTAIYCTDQMVNLQFNLQFSLYRYLEDIYTISV